MNRIAITLFSALLIAPVAAIAESMKSEAPANAGVYFVQPTAVSYTHLTLPTSDLV